jgi:hypothetical protein
MRITLAKRRESILALSRVACMYSISFTNEEMHLGGLFDNAICAECRFGIIHRVLTCVAKKGVHQAKSFETKIVLILMYKSI